MSTTTALSQTLTMKTVVLHCISWLPNQHEYLPLTPTRLQPHANASHSFHLFTRVDRTGCTSVTSRVHWRRLPRARLLYHVDLRRAYIIMWQYRNAILYVPPRKASNIQGHHAHPTFHLSNCPTPTNIHTPPPTPICSTVSCGHRNVSEVTQLNRMKLVQPWWLIAMVPLWNSFRCDVVFQWISYVRRFQVFFTVAAADRKWSSGVVPGVSNGENRNPSRKHGEIRSKTIGPVSNSQNPSSNPSVE